MSSYSKQLKKIEERIEEYWNRSEIDVDLANKLVEDCSVLLGEVHELRRTAMVSAKSLAEYMLFLSLAEKELGIGRYDRLMREWQERIRRARS